MSPYIILVLPSTEPSILESPATPGTAYNSQGNRGERGTATTVMRTHDLSDLPLDWDLAAQRLNADLRDDFFPDPLNHRDLFVAARRGIDRIMDVASYRPEHAESWEIPKANLTLRHCIQLNPIDRLVYQALVDYLIQRTDPRLSDRVYSYRLRDPGAVYMYLASVPQYMACKTAARTAVDTSPPKYLVVTDIAQYYENVDLDKLVRSISEVLGPDLDSVTKSVLVVLLDCLTTWSPYGRRGIPQNMNPSHFLGNTFLHSVDQLMIRSGWDYYRYVDDIRIVVPDEARARLAVKGLIGNLREVGLSVNSQKTSLLAPGSTEWNDFVRSDDPEITAIEAAVRRGERSELRECAKRLYEIAAHLLDEGKSDHRHFRFAINRLSSIKKVPTLSVAEPDGFAIRLVDLLRSNPAYTPTVCDYLSAARFDDQTAKAIARLLSDDPLCVYEWQNYRLWLLAAQHGLRFESLLTKARDTINGPTDGPDKSGAMIYIGSVGDSVDHEIIRRDFRNQKSKPLTLDYASPLRSHAGFRGARERGSVHRSC